jgi:hypothetical protein
MSDNLQRKLIEVDPDPMPGTHLHRRWQDGREIPPVYQGIGGERAAISEADQAGFGAVALDARGYLRVGRTWYGINR